MRGIGGGGGELGAKRDGGEDDAVRRDDEGESNMREFRAQEGFRGSFAARGVREL